MDAVICSKAENRKMTDEEIMQVKHSPPAFLGFFTNFQKSIENSIQ
jgi:hypothetical protein